MDNIYKVISLFVPVLVIVVWYEAVQIDGLEERVEKYKAVERENLEAVSLLKDQLKRVNEVVRETVKSEEAIDARGSEVKRSVEKSVDWGDVLIPTDVSTRLREYSSKD